MSIDLTSAWKVIPTLKSRSIEVTVDFYVQVLGFTLGGAEAKGDSPEELTFCSLFAGHKAAANVYFFKDVSESFAAGWVLIALGTLQLDEYYNLLKDKPTVDITEDLHDTPWGWRQFSVLDPDGNKLTFFKFLEGGNPGNS